MPILNKYFGVRGLSGGSANRGAGGGLAQLVHPDCANGLEQLHNITLLATEYPQLRRLSWMHALAQNGVNFEDRK